MILCNISIDGYGFLYGFENIGVQEVRSWLRADSDEPGWRIQNIDQILQRFSSFFSKFLVIF